MPPTTSPRRNITPEGRAAAGRIAEFRQNVNNGQTSAQARATVRQIEAGPSGMGVTSTRPNPMRVTPPDTIASTDLASNTTFQDVLNRRGELEQQAGIAQQVGQGYDALMGRIGNIQSPLTNPEDTINRLLLNRPTETQNALDTAMGNQAQGFRQFAGQYQEAGQQAREDLGVGSLQSNLAETRNRIAERTNMLRQTLRDFETNAERRGVAREFVQSEKQAVQAEAAAELADLAIIESAQLGNLQQAQQEVDRILKEKAQAFEFENMAIEQEIARLEKMDSREAETRKTQLEIALSERKRNIETALANEKEQRSYLVDAAANGADNGTLDAIRRATTPGEAALLAGPWIGRMDRMAQQANIAQGWAGVKLREQELALAREKFESESSTFGSGTITTQDGQKAVVSSDGTVTPLSEIDFSNPEHVDALPVNDLTKAVMNGYAKSKDLTPTQKAQVASELQAIGFNPNTYVVNKLNALVQTWAGLPESSRGYFEGLKFWESKTIPEVATFESQKQLLTREIARLFDVGVLSDQDVAAYKDAMPSRQDSDINVVISKTAGIAGAAAGTNPEKAGTRIRLPDGREAVVGTDGDTLLDPATGRPLE